MLSIDKVLVVVIGVLFIYAGFLGVVMRKPEVYGKHMRLIIGSFIFADTVFILLGLIFMGRIFLDFI